MAHASETVFREDLSKEELRSLDRLRQGSGRLSEQERQRFQEMGFIECKFGGVVLTATGRYQLDLRARETGLPLLALRYRRRADTLKRIAETMTSDDDGRLHELAAQWTVAAAQLERLHNIEAGIPWLT
jgi:hypothetical protein